MCNYVFFHMGKQFAHSNLSILHLNKIFGPQVECLHRKIFWSPKGTKPSQGPRCDVLEMQGLPLPFTPRAMGWTSPHRAPGSKSLFRGVYAGAKGVPPAQRQIPEVALHGVLLL